MSTKLYDKVFSEALPSIYETRAAYFEAFGDLDVKDGVSDNEVAYIIKTGGVRPVISKYNQDPNVGFGTGTSDTSRLGERQEVISKDLTVPYEAPLSTNQGIDYTTVNDVPERVVNEQLALAAEGYVLDVNVLLGGALSAVATPITGDATTSEGVKTIFNQMSKKFNNERVKGDRIAYVSSDVESAIIDSNLTTSAKRSTADIDTNTVLKFKGFTIITLPEADLAGNDVIATVRRIGKAAVGINVARVIDSDRYIGLSVQTAAKFAKFIPAENNKAILKVVKAPVGG